MTTKIFDRDTDVESVRDEIQSRPQGNTILFGLTSDNNIGLEVYDSGGHCIQIKMTPEEWFKNIEEVNKAIMERLSN